MNHDHHDHHAHHVTEPEANTVEDVQEAHHSSGHVCFSLSFCIKKLILALSFHFSSRTDTFIFGLGNQG